MFGFTCQRKAPSRAEWGSDDGFNDVPGVISAMHLHLVDTVKNPLILFTCDWGQCRCDPLWLMHNVSGERFDWWEKPIHLSEYLYLYVIARVSWYKYTFSPSNLVDSASDNDVLMMLMMFMIISCEISSVASCAYWKKSSKTKWPQQWRRNQMRWKLRSAGACALHTS